MQRFAAWSSQYGTSGLSAAFSLANASSKPAIDQCVCRCSSKRWPLLAFSESWIFSMSSAHRPVDKRTKLPTRSVGIWLVRSPVPETQA